ncbi:hypothetical protein [uncultured Gilvimarinus sp.]|uniref:hypothetical protein n=1 Tax=uncultured Gilvimarinus sp. TaxID=1689143 RepID=UPI0030D95281
MSTSKTIQVTIFAAAIAVICSGATAQDAALYERHTLSDALVFESKDIVGLETEVDMIITGPEGFHLRKSFEAGERIEFIPTVMAQDGLPDGTYRYELRVMGSHGLSSDRNSTQPVRTEPLQGGFGAFSVRGGQIVSSNLAEVSHSGSNLLATNGASEQTVEYGATQEQTFVQDVEIQGSLCVGTDCASSENFGFDTIRIKENNTRIKFDDTSTSGSFPNHDWQLTANDSANGGLNRFSIEDITAASIPFTVEGSAPSNSLYIDDSGRVGFGTSAPVVEAHMADGDSPTLRLEQDGSSGFTAQTWDVAGNEANFFIRDVTNGSKLPFRIKPGAPSDSIFITANGDVGVGTNAPAGAMHIKRSGNVIPLIESTDNNAVQLRFKSDSTNRRFLAVNSDNQAESQIVFGDGLIQFLGQTANDNLMEVDATSLRVNGAIVSNGMTLNVPDYVFEDDYVLMSIQELKTFIDKNSHLPNVPSARDVNENGLNHTEFQLRLLEKIEELTLYTIQQQELIERQGEAIERLEKRLGELN